MSGWNHKLPYRRYRARCRRSRARRQGQRLRWGARHIYPTLPWWWRFIFWFCDPDKSFCRQEAVRCWLVLHPS